jgi:hypothetical protein
VAAYVAQSNEYFQSTDLARRVRIWHETIAPKLEAIEKRGDFDVHDYGTKIISKFGSYNDEQASKVKKLTYNFKELVIGKTPEEASRVFLSTLMLANTYNIDLTAVKSSPNELMPMDNIELTLLSRTRHFQQLQEYQAPSQENFGQALPAASTTSGRIRKQKEVEHDPTYVTNKGNSNKFNQVNSSPVLDLISEEDDDLFVPVLNGSVSRQNREAQGSSQEDVSEDFEFLVPPSKPTSRKPCKRKMNF